MKQNKVLTGDDLAMLKNDRYEKDMEYQEDSDQNEDNQQDD